jgi:DNA (cytosine-5)-methyltransferase 1
MDGAQMGWDDAVRGTVFWNIIEILRLRRPKLVILENVAHFVRHDEGNTYQKVKQALESLGYTVDYHQFSPHQFGVPQIRERIYMVGSLGSLTGFEWPKTETETKDVSIHTVLDKKPADAGKLSPQVIKCLEVWQEFLELFPEKPNCPPSQSGEWNSRQHIRMTEMLCLACRWKISKKHAAALVFR